MSQYCQPRCVMVVMSVMTAGLLQPFVNCHSSYMFMFSYLFLDPKDLRNWLCHSSSVMDVFKTENHCLAYDNFKIQPQLYSMVKYSWLDLIILVGFNYIE